MIVIDASMALSWCLADEHDDLADRVLDRVAAEGAIAPAHWPIEVASGLLAAERRGRLDRAATELARRLLVDLDIDVAPVELTTATGGVLDVARDLGLSAYDAAYLDLARFRGLALATLDADLSRACGQAGVMLAT